MGIKLEESAIKVRPDVAGACEILGIDPMYVANEGKLLAVVPADQAEAVVAAMRDHEHGRDAAVIGTVVADHPGLVSMKTGFGAERIVDMPVGEQLPRIC